MCAYSSACTNQGGVWPTAACALPGRICSTGACALPEVVWPTHCTGNPIYVFPEMKLRGLVPTSYIHVSVSGLYSPKIGLPIWLQQNRQTNSGNI